MTFFKPATKSAVKLRLALTGPAGSGKTMGALLVARGLVGPEGRIALVDTENGSASLYSKLVKFDTIQMNPPYLVDKYLKAINAAVEEKYDAIVVDSLTHAWSGEGGILQRKEQLDSRGGNSFTNWAKMTPEQNLLVTAVLHSPIHIIATMRSKTEYVISENERGKAAPKKVGLAPIQRDGFDYEFDLCLDIAMNHTAQASKDRTGMFEETVFKINEDLGVQLSTWLNEEVKDDKKQE